MQAAPPRSDTLGATKGRVMKIPCLPVTFAIVMALLPLASEAAEAGAVAPVAVASAAPSAKPSPRLSSPTDPLDNPLSSGGLPSGGMRPSGDTTPQLTIPLGKNPPPPLKTESRAVQRDKAGSRGGINDSVARCEAQSTAEARAKCREKAARDAASR
jgi:hypothetical protein